MPKQYTQEQLDKAYEKLPEELRAAIFSMETAEAIWSACEQQGITDKRISTIAKYAGDVLLGLMLPSEFPQILEKEVKVPKKIAQEIAREINRFVFYPVKPVLEQLHRMEIEVTAKIVTPKPSEQPGGQPGEQGPEQKPMGDDSYREPVE